MALPEPSPAPAGDGPHRLAFLAAARDGSDFVSIHSKVSLAIKPNGDCRPADEPSPFLTPESGIDDSDVIPYKTATDLIVMASAYGSGGRPASEFEASIEVGKIRRVYRLNGERRVLYRGRGSIQFSKPTLVECVPLTYARAYGGYDALEPMPEGALRARALGFHPGLYPRNPIGLGYVVREEKERLDGLELPNVEHPEYLLTPQNLVVGDASQWWRQPIPWSCDWFGKTWFPRVAFFGGVPDDFPDDDRETAEVKLGWLDPYCKKRAVECSLDQMLDDRMGNAASPGLVLPFLKGNESIALRGMRPQGDLVVNLPLKPPKMEVVFSGKTYEVTPVPHRILISVMEMGAYIVWHGAWKPPKALPYRLPEEAGPRMLARHGIQVRVDGDAIVPTES
ncbi:MAG: DUF2169 domain-containing protein [Planctomycetes bacterium]|nr:DUF2169 domain-containing protein [Planctomycetota bacterium]